MDEQDLNELDAMFAEIGGNEGAEEMANSFQNLPDGVYEAEVINAEGATSQNSGMPMIVIEYGLENGKTHRQYLSLANKNGDVEKTKSAISRAVTNLRKFGLDSDSIKGYISQLDKMIGKRVTLTLTTKGEYQNTSVEVH